ncbi:MAG: hypothetical protein B9S32_09735 [Verrucomicrobia bacterium Tous-C9LFEB]|nr:MAG: hypothetical protein B9S32_09735 [Verrucomicrobia bacterium Tous-C9LFEB]
MADQFYLFRRGNGRYYAQDRISKRQTSLNTSNASQAKRLIAAKNQASEMPALNMAMARAYLTAKSPELVNRTWADVMRDLELSYSGSTLLRWGKVIKSPPFRLLANIKLIDTESSHFMEVLRHKRAGVSTNVWLRILHNRALDLGWLLAPVLVKRAWPKIRYGQKRAITAKEHEKIIASENLDDYRLYFKLLWETGGSQSDIANLSHDDIDRENNRLYYCRQKVATRGFGSVTIAIGPRIREILKELPKEGWIPLFNSHPAITLSVMNNGSSRAMFVPLRKERIILSSSDPGGKSSSPRHMVCGRMADKAKNVFSSCICASEFAA